MEAGIYRRKEIKQSILDQLFKKRQDMLDANHKKKGKQRDM